MLRALLFDFDGLILDTEGPVYEAWRDDYLAHGHDLPLEVYAACVGSDFNRFDPKSHLESLVGGRIDWEERDEWRERNALDRVRQLSPLPGVVSLLDAASAAGLPCAVASSSPRSWVEGHLSRLGLLDRFVLTRCLDDVRAPKPAPDLFLAAAEGLGVAPVEAIVFEDSRNGLLAAMAAGCPCIVVPNRVTAHLDFTGAAAVIGSLEEFDLRGFSGRGFPALSIRDFEPPEVLRDRRFQKGPVFSRVEADPSSPAAVHHLTPRASPTPTR